MRVLLTASPLSTRCARMKCWSSGSCKGWMGCQAGKGSGMVYQWTPAYGFLWACSSPSLLSHNPLLRISPTLQCTQSVLPLRVLLNSGFFPTALQKDLLENLTRQVRSRNIIMKPTLFIWKQSNSTPTKNWQTPAHEQQQCSDLLGSCVTCWGNCFQLSGYGRPGETYQYARHRPH